MSFRILPDHRKFSSSHKPQKPMPTPLESGVNDYVMQENRFSYAPADSLENKSLKRPRPAEFFKPNPSVVKTGRDVIKLHLQRKSDTAVQMNSEYSPILEKTLDCLEVRKSLEEKDIDNFKKALLNCQLNRNPYFIQEDEHLYIPKIFRGEEVKDYYINAGKIDFRIGDKTFSYIATQGPLRNTLNDFWKMVVLSDAQVVISLAMPIENNKTKCLDYWSFPSCQILDGEFNILGRLDHTSVVSDASESEDGSEDETPFTEMTEKGMKDFYENFNPLETQSTIDCMDLVPHSENFADESSCDIEQRIVKSSFTFTSNDGSFKKTIEHYQYYNWPDQGAPSPKVFNELLEMIEEKKLVDSPPVVHCSVGVGRTGTFIATSIARNYVKAQIDQNIPPSIDVEHIITEMRKIRMGMVQTVEQVNAILNNIHTFCREYSTQINSEMSIETDTNTL